MRFLFDEDDPPNKEDQCDPGQGSAYLRMMQPHAGDIEGFHFPLRRDTEVMVAFIGGDPDRPVIAGSVPNAVTPSPVTDKNYTQNVIKTGGRNHITFEDKEGKEWIFAGSPNKNSYLKLGLHPDESAHVRLHTDASSEFTFGGGWRINVGADLYEEVGGAVDEIYNSGTNTTVTGNRQMSVTGLEKHDVGDYTLNVKGAYTRESTTTKVTSSNTDLDLGMTNVKASMIGVDSGRIAVTTGALTGTMNAISLSVPGGVMIDTPSWKVNTPGCKWFTRSKFGVTGRSTAVTGLNQSNTVLSVSSLGIGMTMGGASASEMAFQQKKAGVQVKLAGTVTLANGVTTSVSGLVTMA